jgi:hypothetical protein
VCNPPRPRRRHGVRNAREKVSDSSRGRTPRRRLPPGDVHKHREIGCSTALVLMIGRSGQVAPPNLAAHRTRCRALLQREVGRSRVRHRAGGREIRRTRSVALSRSTALSRANDGPRGCPRAMRARRLRRLRARRYARRAFASRPPAPPRSLLAALAPGRRFHRPHPSAARPAAASCPRPAPRDCACSPRMPHITPPAPLSSESRRSPTASRPPPPSRLDPVADRRV